MRKYILFVFFLLLIPSCSTAKDVKLLISGSEEKIDSYKKNDIHFVSFSEIVELVGGTLDWKVLGHSIQFVEDTNRFEFVIGSPYFKRNDSLFNMTYEAGYKKGKLFLPAETFLQFWDEVIFQKVVWDSGSKTIRINSEYFNVTDLSITKKSNGLLLEVFLTSALSYDIFITEGNWINISIRDGMLNRSQIQSRKNSRYMYKLKTHQQNSTGQISLRLKRKIDKWHHKLQNNPPRIQISIADNEFEMPTVDTQPTIGPDNKIDIIVIDAGHGGKDYGAIGQNNLREKDVSLGIAKELAKLIRKDKLFKVIMTRDKDKTMTLEERAEIANASSCDLFISIHANASPKKHVRGWNVFFLAQALNDSARAIAQFENSSFLRDQEPEQSTESTPMVDYNDPILGIISEMIITEFQVESYDFAVMVDREFRKGLDIPARGVDQAGFFVLNKVYAPSVLLETGFITNKKEEKILKNRKYQKKVASAVYKAIKRFKAKHESN